jgi:hypothetical protein
MARGSSRNRNVHRFPTTTPGKFIEISVAYCEGGLNNFSGATNSRAYYLHATPVEIEDRGNGIVIKTCQLFHGLKQRLELVKRFSEKKLDEWARVSREECETRDIVMMRLVNRVLEQENLQLQEAVTA